MFKAWSERPQAPKDAKEYQLTLPKDLEGFLNPNDDKVLPIFRDVAHKLGLSQSQFEGTVVGLHQAMVKAGLLEKPVPMNDIWAEIGAGPGDKATQIQRGQTRVLETIDQIEALATRSQISKDDAKALAAALGSPAQVGAMQRLLALLPKEQGVQGGGGGGQQSTDPQAALKAMYPSMFRVA